MFNRRGENNQIIVHLIFALKWLSETKLKARSKASRQKCRFRIFWREVSLRAFSFASLSLDNKMDD